MKILNIQEPIDYSEIYPNNIVLAMGFFDGVHKGHRDVINEAKKQSKLHHLKLAVMTFDRYPKIYFKNIKENEVYYLTMVSKRLELFQQLGVDITYVAKFNHSLASLSPQDFVNKYMTKLNAKIVVAGFDYTYGIPSIANMDLLPKYSHGKFETVKVKCRNYNGEKIGTSLLKKMLDTGNISKVNNLLGYNFSFYGTVVHGNARGRTLGFPTLNIKTNLQQKIPMVGVYAVRVFYDSKLYYGMASISHNTTFGNNLPLTIEINLFNFNKMIYGEQIEVEWDKYLRPPQTFDNKEQLISQLKKDKEHTKKYFKII